MNRLSAIRGGDGAMLLMRRTARTSFMAGPGRFLLARGRRSRKIERMVRHVI